jgi:hypothetical protein
MKFSYTLLRNVTVLTGKSSEKNINGFLLLKHQTGQSGPLELVEHRDFSAKLE